MTAPGPAAAVTGRQGGDFRGAGAGPVARTVPAWLADPVVIAVLGLLIAAVALGHGIDRSYVTTPDADIVYVYEALLFNQGLLQDYFDHTGYVYFLLLGGWLRLGHGLGLLPAAGLDQIAAAPDFEAAYAALVVAGRWLSIGLAALFAALFYLATTALCGSRVIAGGAALVFALEPGLAHHALILRTELPAVLFAFLAFVAGLLAGRATGTAALVRLAGAGFFAMLAMMTKMQVIFLLLAFPGLALLAGSRARPDRTLLAGPLRPLLVCLAATVLVAPALVMMVQEIVRVRLHHEVFAAIAPLPYQALLALLVAGLIALYGWWYRVPPGRQAMAVAAIAVGIALAQYLNLIWHDRENTLLLVNFIEHMKRFAGHHNQTDAVSLGGMGQDLLTGLADLVGRHFSLAPHPGAPLKYLEWLVLANAAGLLLAGRPQPALVAAGLVAMALIAEAAFTLRWQAPHYLIFVSPWVLLAAALTTAGFRQSLAASVGGTVFAVVAAGAVVATLAVTIPAILAPGLVPVQAPENACAQAGAYLHRLPHRFDRYCRPAAPTEPGRG